MRKLLLLVLPVVFIMCAAYTGFAQNKAGNLVYISNDRIYFQLNRQWSEKKRMEYARLFSLDSALMARAYTQVGEFEYDSTTWRVENIGSTHFELSRALQKSTYNFSTNDVFLREDEQAMKQAPSVQAPDQLEKFGINKFSTDWIFRYERDTAWFFIPGMQSRKQVFISGTFNNWSTMQHEMHRTRGGWITGIPLKPGKYLYKYIVDGRWLHDQENMLAMADGQGGYNSVVYCYNYTFRLQGFNDAKKVFLSGNFNNWRHRQLRMERTPDGWQLPIYLRMGTHVYKYIVDGNWITDPGNRNIATDANGNQNSLIGIGDTMIFRLDGFQQAKTVILTGSFNDWSQNELTMHKTAGGWELPYVLAPGNHEYKFILDGQWITDPANSCTTGSGDFINSCLVFKPNHTFVLDGFEDAESVIVTGTFNNWSHKEYRMHKENGRWTKQLYLQPGKHAYKFIVNGEWMIDPANDNWETNNYGTGNSVIWK